MNKFFLIQNIIHKISTHKLRINNSLHISYKKLLAIDFSLITETVISILTTQTYFEIHMKIVYIL